MQSSRPRKGRPNKRARREQTQWHNGLNLDLMDAMTPLRAPGAMLLALEARAPLELGATLAAWPLLRNAPQGDGHAVIVFPGLAAGDLSTAPLRNFLATLGYETFGWDLGLNLGPRDGVLARSLERVQRIAEDSGRKVSLIGWSLGGIYAREFAKSLPQDVRCVITLGTPFAGDPKATNAWRLYEFASGHKLEDPDLLERIKRPPPVPTTSIFSKSDGVVSWPLSIQNGGRQTENIEVVASHMGMGLNPATLYAVADRLAQPEGKWSRFHREGWRQWFFRDHQPDAS
jgi:pimeloyl-ACP methyl ester carboxylesterase